ncbi:YisL family protein [Metabacillus sp. GX 13764]|uniref:YisL family protein n=1 Tax=Metabacillus kandeliae TaxID=2900151 RepID=UPI001E38E73D|nr:YisL family protein [Metabacillus kandeliae]MCD7034908.1 YisL family protein [Metabacillus kandeliae]
MTTHLHITAWALGIILFFAAVFLFQSGKAKPFKIVHMITRVFYILILASGLQLFLAGYTIKKFTGEYYGKLLIGLVILVLMEMILVRMKKGKALKGLWIGFVIALVLVIFLGLRLPLGFHPFS